MALFNDCRFIGRLTTDPVLRKTNDDISVSTFTLAVDREYPDSKSVYHTDFPEFVAWKGQAEKVCSRYKKGDLLGVRGNYRISVYIDRDGIKRFAPQFIVNEVRLISRYNALEPISFPQNSDIPCDYNFEGEPYPEDTIP